MLLVCLRCLPALHTQQRRWVGLRLPTRARDLKHYYERKVAEGKSKMSVLNAVRNKLLARVVACVNNQKEYVKKVA